MNRRAQAVAAIALAMALAALAAWRAKCVLAGPDQDTDAYAHHMIARAILADPRDLAVHWVWLPLFHYAQVPLVALGGTMDDVRWLNVVFAAALPVGLYAHVRRTANPGASAIAPEAVALVAALFAAACPIAMQMGTTAQPEPAFALLVLGVAVAIERRRHFAAACLLAAAAMLRYEAWAVVALVGAMLVIATLAGRRVGASAWRILLLPAALVLAWAALRRPVDGAWFGFLGQTHSFANDATHAGGTLRAADLLYYPVWVALRTMGPALPLAAFGVARTVRQQGASFVLVPVACLAFVSLTWATRSSLGLDRHFVVAVPLYATFAAQGMAAIADALARWLRPASARAVAALAAVASLAAMLVALDVWMGHWLASIERGWPARSALGARLRELPATATIFCDEATIEILSGLDRRRFDRHWIDDPHTWARIDEAARRDGETFVATWERKVGTHRGEVVFRSQDAPDAPAVELVRVRPSRY